ncbi:MAG: hypothetical protein GXP03_02685 [Alphaproteobacteria bacterium]|nr:hypothetical protein [Alphaproteobacteria bacterium]
MQVRTCYVYGADGGRVKKIEGLTDTSECANLQGAGNVTVYFGGVEIRDFGEGNSETILLYPQGNVRQVYTYDSVTGTVVEEVAYLNSDQLNSVRTVTSSTGGLGKRSTYRPFGEIDDWNVNPAVAVETKGFIPLSGF